MKYLDGYIVDEDENKIVGEFFGEEKEAVEWFKACKEERNPDVSSYWNTWSLYRRWAA